VAIESGFVLRLIIVRKTGLTVADTGIRDENGLEPMDHLFSSPEKGTKARGMNGHRRNTDATISSEEDMEMEESMQRTLRMRLSQRC
jgi:hypothetical protein